MYNTHTLYKPSIMKKVTNTLAQVIAVPVKTGVVDITLVYVEQDGVLFSIKPKDFAVLQAAPSKSTLDKYFSGSVLKHNPTCVFNTSTGRRSFDPARPMYIIGKVTSTGKPVMVKLPTSAEPVKVEVRTSGGKTIKVTSTGPGTIYIRLSNTDKRPYSLKPDQFEAVKKDPTSIKYMGLLKHLPTCVEISMVQGLISTDANRPMFELSKGKLVQIHAPGMEPKVEKAAKVKGEAEASPKAKPETKAERIIRKATEAANKVETEIQTEEEAAK